MSSSAAAAPVSEIGIDLLNDLKDGSHLKSLLQQSSGALLSISRELAQFASQPVADAVASKPAKVTISTSATWKTSGGIGFSLTPKAICSIGIADRSTKFPVVRGIDSSETQDIVSGPTAGKVYVNIDLDFSISGSVSGSGTVSGIGISGKATGSASATLSYCHAVDATSSTIDALKSAFSAVSFPFEPDCALGMGAGDVSRVSFAGTLQFGVDVSYGLGSYKFSASGVGLVGQSVKEGFEKLTVPDVKVEAGAKASVSYTHSDRFGAIVQKTDDQSAHLYLVRSNANEWEGSVGVTVGVSVTPIGATVDQAVLAKAVDGVTGSGGDKAAALADQLQSSLVDRTNKWLSAQKGDVGLLVQLSHHTSRALLYRFDVDLTKADLTRQSWEKFAAGDVAAATRIGGMTLEPGSGVGSELENSVTVGLHFFNFFNISDKTTYFKDSYTEIGPDGSIRFLYNVGKETEAKTKSALVTSRIHFVASAAPADKGQIEDADVDLAIELSETNKAKDGNVIAAVIGSLPPSATVQSAQTGMHQFVANTPAGTLKLAIKLKPSAYGKLACSPYTGPKGKVPPAAPQEQDHDNWEAFHDASRKLLDLQFLDKLSYRDWAIFNEYCVGGSPSGNPDRLNIGSPGAVPPSYYDSRGLPPTAPYFLVSSARFMNLCDDLHALAGTLSLIDTQAAWDRLLDNLTAMAHNEEADWSRPSARAILQLCGSNATAQVDLHADDKSHTLTCGVTMS